MTRPTLLSTFLGFVSGVCATGPMSAAMIALHRRLPEPEKYPLPPEEIAENVLLSKQSDSQCRGIVTWLAHFGYGGAAGAIYANTNFPMAPILSGPLFGLIVWVASYFGLLPALGILSRADKHPLRRSLLMILVHLFWGLLTAVLWDVLLSDNKRISSAFHGSPRRREDA